MIISATFLHCNVIVSRRDVMLIINCVKRRITVVALLKTPAWMTLTYGGIKNSVALGVDGCAEL